MKLETPVNENYAAVVVEVKTLVDLENSDFLVGLPLLGYQAVVSKGSVHPGMLGILFTAETQLSEEFCRVNNLFRDPALNADLNSKGYMEANRRVRAMKLRGNVSNALFMPLTSLNHIKVNIIDLKPGDTFDQLDGHDICNKYVVKTKEQKPGVQKEKKVSKVDEKVFPQHIDTAQYHRVKDQLDPNADVVVTAKLHGTSIRVSNTVVKRDLTWKERFAKRFGVKVKAHEYAMVYGSRRTIKDVNGGGTDFYDSNLYVDEGRKLDGLLPKGYMVFGELVGYTSTGSEIQKGYTYQTPKNTARLFVYRVAVLNEDGNIVDLSWDALKEFCTNRNLQYVPELWRGKLRDLDVNSFMDQRFFDMGYDSPPLDDKHTVDEGICIRLEGITPKIVKAKSNKFYEFETKLLDQNVVDMESEDV